MICGAGDVVLTAFPFVDMDVSKLRPALALSEQALNSEIGATVLVMITGARASRWPTDIVVQDWRAASLRAPSIIRSKIFTLDNRLISRHLGVLSDRDREDVRRMLRSLVAL